MPQENATVNKDAIVISRKLVLLSQYIVVMRSIFLQHIAVFIFASDLFRDHHISRTPVRQALGRLVAEGLLEKKRKKGCIIPFPTPEDAQKIFQPER
jgi:hypothetical protein